MFRLRASSFCVGFAVATAGSMYLLQRDLWASHKSLSNQAEGYHAELEGRIARLESITSVLAPSATQPSSSIKEPATPAEAT